MARVAQDPQINKTTLLGRTLQVLKDYLPETEDKGQTSIWVQLIF